MKSREKVIQLLIKQQKTRTNVIKQMNRQRNGCLSFVSNQIGYNSWQDEKERKKKWSDAEKIFKAVKNGGDKNQIAKIIGDKKQAKILYEIVGDFILVTSEGLNSLIEYRLTLEKQMSQDAAKLPISNWWTDERGRGLLGLAIIIGEAGDLSGYENPAKLWKRFGVAVLDGVRQGGLTKNAKAEEWIEHGYNKRRRSVLWTIGDTLLKTNGKTGRYKKIYDKRKEFENKRLKKEWIEQGKKEKTYKSMKAHRRAQRYMEKRLLRDLWNVWNEVI